MYRVLPIRLPIDNFGTFPSEWNSMRIAISEFLTFTNSFGDQGGYAVGLKAGDVIGATGTSAQMYQGLVEGTRWDFQEGTNFLARWHNDPCEPSDRRRCRADRYALNPSEAGDHSLRASARVSSAR